MPLIRECERELVTLLNELMVSNPFRARRIELERAALGSDFVRADSAWNLHATSGADHPNLERLETNVAGLIESVHARLGEGVQPDDEDRASYETLVLLLLYYRFRDRFDESLQDAIAHPDECRCVAAYDDFEQLGRSLLQHGALRLEATVAELPHLFACCVQIRRAFMEIFTHIIGVSAPIVDLRAKVWESIFSHDMRRYRRLLYRIGSDTTTLVTGPSGTGKELVASAIARAQYIPFDAETRAFRTNHTRLFHPLNLSALSPALVESELFGHRRGAFTGAVADRAGWLEQCPEHGTVFLDEIGDLDPQIQVKLLRVLQSRTFQSIGDTETRRFRGKIIAATNRDLMEAMDGGGFRSDFYYRLCADMITTPSLAEQVRDAPDQLSALVQHIAERIVGTDEAPALSAEVQDWIDEHLGADYAWPGNVRELEQCVRNVLVRRSYHPLPRSQRSTREALGAAVAAGGLGVDELLDRYCRLVYEDVGTYEGAAERLGLDRRTVRKRVAAAKTRDG